MPHAQAESQAATPMSFCGAPTVVDYVKAYKSGERSCVVINTASEDTGTRKGWGKQAGDKVKLRDPCH